MNKTRMWYALPVVLLLVSSFPAAQRCGAQAPASPPAIAPVKIEAGGSYASEPYVIESLQSRVRFEADGKGQRDFSLRARVQSESAVRDFGLLVYPYVPSFENLEVVYARVRKPDGTTVETPASDMQELDSAVSREAPMYTDQREKHIAVKSLAVGDVLELALRWKVHDAVAPGHFWYDDNFFHAGICLAEELTIDVPSSVAVKFSKVNPAPEIQEKNGRVMYTFHTSHLKREEDEKIPGWEKNFYGAEPPEVRLSSFRSWEEVGAWYGGLQQARIAVTPGIRAKAEELTKGKTTESEKIQAIYDFVATRFRYIGIDLGRGRYTPHAPEDVLANRYGDCKDKHTLFTALLQAAGIAAYPALIGAGYKFDASVPTVSLFDHVITAIPQGDSFLFLDTTLEVSPYGMLAQGLRDRAALVIPAQGPARLVTTPPNPPFANRETFRIDAAIDMKGTLDGKVHIEDRGDPELILRLAFRGTAENRWKDLMQAIAGRMGFAGTVSDVAAARPEATAEPFWISFQYHRPEYSEWKDKRITLPLPPIFLPELNEEQKASKDPLPLGSPQEVNSEATLKLPEGITPVLPANVERKNEFAEFAISYSYAKGVLRGTRHLATKVREIRGTARGEYSAFVKAVDEAERKYIFLKGEVQSDDSMREGRKLLYEGKTHEAVALLEKTLEADPSNYLVQFMLGSAYLRLPDEDKAMAQFQKALEARPEAWLRGMVAFELADTNHRLKEALDYAERDVAETEAETGKAELDSLKPEDYARTVNLSAVWDTLGWVKFRLGELDAAERYLESAWMLEQSRVIGVHLVEVLEKQGKGQEAMRICRMALAAPRMAEEPPTQERLLSAQARLTGPAKPPTGKVGGKMTSLPISGAVELSEMRAVKIPLTVNLHGESRNATFAIALVNGPKVEKVKFLGGSEELQGEAAALYMAKYQQPFPEETPTTIVRIGLLSCSKYVKDCTLVLMPLQGAGARITTVQ